MTEPAAAFDALLQGYHRFRAGGWASQRARWAELADGQSPKVMVIACSDSRVDPSQIFDVSPGEIFVMRNIANLVPPFETTPGRHGVSAALEYAVTQLEVQDVVVMGHGACGGCKAALMHLFADAAPGEGGFVDAWVSLLSEAREKVLAEYGDTPAAVRAMEQEAVKVSLANLRTFPFVVPREAAGTLRLRGAYFAIADGQLHLLDEATGEFTAAQA
jgi:carbonic anhydrase